MQGVENAAVRSIYLSDNRRKTCGRGSAERARRACVGIRARRFSWEKKTSRSEGTHGPLTPPLHRLLKCHSGKTTPEKNALVSTPASFVTFSALPSRT